MSEDVTSPPTRRARLLELDLLRFLAAMAVVIYHYTGTTGGPWQGETARGLFEPISALTRFGYLGVELFFLISGFVILMSAWGRSMADFATSRIVRLYPAYWVSVLLIGAIYLGTGMGRGAPEKIIPNLTMFQQGMGVDSVSRVFWTLWVEMHFYALISILVLAGITYQRCITFMTAWTVLAIFADESDNKLLEGLLITDYASFFIAGMAFYLIHRFGSSLLLWALVAFSWAGSIRYALAEADRYQMPPVDAWPGIPAIITLIFIVMALVATGRLGRLRWRHFTTLGALTYPVYLVHYEIAPPLAREIYPAMPLWGAMAVLVAVSLAVAYAIHRLVEKPLSAWMKPRLQRSFERIQLADAARTRSRRARPHTGPQDDPAPEAPRTNESHVVHPQPAARPRDPGLRTMAPPPHHR